MEQSMTATMAREDLNGALTDEIDWLRRRADELECLRLAIREAPAEPAPPTFWQTIAAQVTKSATHRSNVYVESAIRACCTLSAESAVAWAAKGA